MPQIIYLILIIENQPTTNMNTMYSLNPSFVSIKAHIEEGKPHKIEVILKPNQGTYEHIPGIDDYELIEPMNRLYGNKPYAMLVLDFTNKTPREVPISYIHQIIYNYL